MYIILSRSYCISSKFCTLVTLWPWYLIAFIPRWMIWGFPIHHMTFSCFHHENREWNIPHRRLHAPLSGFLQWWTSTGIHTGPKVQFTIFRIDHRSSAKQVQIRSRCELSVVFIPVSQGIDYCYRSGMKRSMSPRACYGHYLVKFVSHSDLVL